MSSAEEEVQAKKKVSNSNHQKPPFLEVTCKGTRKVRRFAMGTEAGFALSSINRKLDSGIPPASYIEAFKEGEEPVIFGPSSVLVDYGNDWRLQAVPEGDYKESKSVKPTVKQSPAVQRTVHLSPARKSSNGSASDADFLYFGKILLAFCFIFLLGGTFSLILENLPNLILFVTSFFP